MTTFNPRDLRLGATLEHTSAKNADGTPLRARVNGKPKLWKTRPDDFKVPLKYGMKTCFYLTPENVNDWTLPTV